MQKKSVRVSKGEKKSPSKRELEEALVENFVKLQRVMANMSFKFDNLSDQISKLLQLFEISAKSFVKKQEEGGSGDKDLLKKVDSLLNQNKTIATGLTLIEEKLKHKIRHESPNINMPNLSDSQYTEAELHGLYPGNIGGRPRPGSLPRF